MKLYFKLGIMSLILASNLVRADVASGWYAGILGAGGKGSHNIPFGTAPLTNNLLAPPLLIGFVDGTAHYGAFGAGGGQIGYRCGRFRFEVEALVGSSNLKKASLHNLNVFPAPVAPGISPLYNSPFFNPFLDSPFASFPVNLRKNQWLY